MKYLYLIPARGGSKGIPGKNIKPFLGKPLIAYAIAQALDLADDPADVCVSTDSPEIAEVAREWGANVPFLRPQSLALDSSGSHGVILHALDFMEKNGTRYDAVVLLQPTSPLRSADDIRRTISIFEENPGADMAVTVKEADANPYYNAFEADAHGFLHLSKDNGDVARRQDAPKVWQYNGAVYVINPRSVSLSPLSRFKRVVPCVMDPHRSVDLDTPLDWIIAETIARCGIENNKSLKNQL
ncbi:MAG: acylneuraminate cytidylyltransferase family protein [Muribaculum sp.]|nr:acylneuraminate cytidylyltransferase family protein [Muribaculum sp.]